MKILNVKDAVENLLLTSALCREDDNRLIVSIWAHHLGDEAINKMTAIELLNLFSDGKLPHPESIMRVRRKLQEVNVNYRGKNYKERKNEQEKVINDLKEIAEC